MGWVSFGQNRCLGRWVYDRTGVTHPFSDVRSVEVQKKRLTLMHSAGGAGPCKRSDCQCRSNFVAVVVTHIGLFWCKIGGIFDGENLRKVTPPKMVGRGIVFPEQLDKMSNAAR